MNPYYLVLIGIISGIISSMGMGGGTVLVLILGIFISIDQISLQGINLLYFVPIGVFSIIFHFKNNNIDKKTAATIIPFGIIGAVIGAFAANMFVSVQILKNLFGLFVLCIGILTLKKERSNFEGNQDIPEE